MKKLLTLILATLMLLSFAACGNAENETEITAEDGSKPISAEENVLSVTVTLAATLFEDETKEEIIASAKENGISKCVVNEDGSVTYTMSKSKHKEMLEDLEKSIADFYNELLNGEEKVASFVEIKNNEDFSEFNVYVDSSKYSMWDSMNAMAFYIQGIYYQCLSGADFNAVDVVVNFVDSETDEIIDSASYRKFADNMADSES